jgi:low temperature requirement protein LtrA
VQPVSTLMTANDDGNDSGQASDGDHSQGNLELFFDLVFVFAMSQVTRLMLSHLTWVGFGRGVLALLAVWWAWERYTWLTNALKQPP